MNPYKYGKESYTPNPPTWGVWVSWADTEPTAHYYFTEIEATKERNKLLFEGLCSWIVERKIAA